MKYLLLALDESIRVYDAYELGVIPPPVINIPQPQPRPITCDKDHYLIKTFKRKAKTKCYYIYEEV